MTSSSSLEHRRSVDSRSLVDYDGEVDLKEDGCGVIDRASGQKFLSGEIFESGFFR